MMNSLSVTFDRKYEELFSSNCIDYPIAAFANPIEMLQALDLRGAGGIEAGAECMEPFYEKYSKGIGQCAELLFGWRSHENCEDYSVHSYPQFFQYGIKGLSPFLVCLSQSHAGIDEIDTVFQSLQEPEIIEGYHRGDCSATSA
jgi:hypothetical protein